MYHAWYDSDLVSGFWFLVSGFWIDWLWFLAYPFLNQKQETVNPETRNQKSDLSHDPQAHSS
jgi:hypothetical protein